MPKLTTGGVLSEAWSLYRLLWRRSVVTAGAIFAVVALASALADAARRHTALAELVALALSVVGGALVQGALVEVVRDVHEGRDPAAPAVLVERARPRVGSLLLAAIAYGFGVAVGFFLLVVPGLIVLARWALIVPIVVIERRPVREAIRRSSELVRGTTGRVLGAVLVSLILTSAASVVIGGAFSWLPHFFATWIGGALAGALTAPFEAHVLTVLYYRLTEPERPVVAPRGKSWPSIWDEQES